MKVKERSLEFATQETSDWINGNLFSFSFRSGYKNKQKKSVFLFL